MSVTASRAFLLLTSLAVAAMSSCSENSGTRGTSTLGNPLIPQGANQLLYVACGAINRCLPQTSISGCTAGIASASINSQVGVATAFESFSDLEQGESQGLLVPNLSALDACTSAIAILSCSDPLLSGSYNPALPNPYSGAANIFPPYASCSSVYSQKASSADSSNYRYVRAGATGAADGSSWTNACPGFTGPCAGSALRRKTTYYVASGDYGSVTFSAPAPETGAITIKKATASDHGTETGWVTSYASGPARFADWTFSTGNFILDGNGRTSPTSGHGFQLNMPALSAGCDINFCNAISAPWDAHVDNVTIRYTEIVGYGVASTRDLTGIFFMPTGLGRLNNFKFSSGYMHDFGTRGGIMTSAGDVGAQTWTIEDSVFARMNGEGIKAHFSSNVTIRNNRFQDVSGNAVIVTVNAGSPFTLRNWAIYGNVFAITDPATYGVSNGVIACMNGNICKNWLIYNNTISGFTSPGSYRSMMQFSTSGAGSSGNVVQNNLWYNSLDSDSSDPSVSLDYNAYFSTTGVTSSEAHGQYASGNPFVSLPSGNYHLSSPTNPGITLPAPFHVDPDGTERAAGSHWNRGAY